MNLSAEQQNRLSRILSVELECARSLAAILQREHSALKSRDPDRVLEISSEKQQAVEQMQLSGRQREQLLASLRVAPGSEGIEALFQANPDTACTDLWRQLGEIAGQLREQNEINGGILALSQRHNQQALDILCGRTESRNTYGAKGQHHQTQSGHTLTKA
ncbi:flagella synthesis protein FlgN [Sedimenticola hydrogenitrophicus]|uniref:flagella synthesis protein FlgN n=1 Tax=Sedimenticola hydrogenitrophicus TaxID=2967975 RepID=UPI0023B0FE54